MTMLTEHSQNDPKCVEVPSNLITNEQIQISCLVLFFIPHNVIRQIDNIMIVLMSQKISSAEKMLLFFVFIFCSTCAAL